MNVFFSLRSPLRGALRRLRKSLECGCVLLDVGYYVRSCRQGGGKRVVAGAKYRLRVCAHARISAFGFVCAKATVRNWSEIVADRRGRLSDLLGMGSLPQYTDVLLVRMQRAVGPEVTRTITLALAKNGSPKWRRKASR